MLKNCRRIEQHYDGCLPLTECGFVRFWALVLVSILIICTLKQHCLSLSLAYHCSILYCSSHSGIFFELTITLS